MELCKCDQHAAQCFKRNDYNPRYRKYDRKKCLSLSGLNDFEEEEEVLDNIPTKDELKNWTREKPLPDGVRSTLPREIFKCIWFLK